MKEAFDNYAFDVEDQKAVADDTDLSDDEMIEQLEQVDADVGDMIERLMSGRNRFRVKLLELKQIQKHYP